MAVDATASWYTDIWRFKMLPTASQKSTRYFTEVQPRC